jgi:hypothetical protein
MPGSLLGGHVFSVLPLPFLHPRYRNTHVRLWEPQQQIFVAPERCVHLQPVSLLIFGVLIQPMPGPSHLLVLLQVPCPFRVTIQARSNVSIRFEGQVNLIHAGTEVGSLNSGRTACASTRSQEPSVNAALPFDSGSGSTLGAKILHVRYLRPQDYFY